MIHIDVNIDDDQLVEGLAALARQGEDASPIMRGLAGIMRSAAEDAFDLERDPVTGAAWPPLNAAYKKKRYEDGYTGKILSRTGRMQQTLIKQSMSAPIRAADGQSLRKETVVCTSKWYEVKDISGLVLIETSFPITLLIGGAQIQVTGVFAFTVSAEAIILVAETPTQVTITSIISNL